MQERHTQMLAPAFWFCLMAASLISFAANEIRLEDITIEKKNEDIFPGEDPQAILYSNNPCASLEESVEYFPGVDLKKRGAAGLQQDISLRGAGFEDAQVRVNSIPMNDPQTGHYTLEIPFTSALIQGVKVTPGRQSIDFFTVAPDPQERRIGFIFGEHALWEKIISLGASTGRMNHQISFEHKNSSGERQDTDFETATFSLHSFLKDTENELELLMGATKRDFGAGNSYASSYPHQEEHITQTFYSVRGLHAFDGFSLEITPYLRRHTDTFILDRRNPSFYTNSHTTYVSGIQQTMRFPSGFFVSLSNQNESISSTRLKDHLRWKEEFACGRKHVPLGNSFTGYKIGFVRPYTRDFLPQLELDLGHHLSETMTTQVRFTRLPRVPSFTELYYVSPVDQGNPDLDIQTSDNVELEILYRNPREIFLKGVIFFRHQEKSIDWIRNTSSDPWRAVNSDTVQAQGIELTGQFPLKVFCLRNLGFGYSYLTLDPTNPRWFSKYLFDYNRHTARGILGLDIDGVAVNLIGSWMHPAKRSCYATVDLRCEKKFSRFSVFLEGTNIFNANFFELDTIKGQGRWYKFGAVYSF